MVRRLLKEAQETRLTVEDPGELEALEDLPDTPPVDLDLVVQGAGKEEQMIQLQGKPL